MSREEYFAELRRELQVLPVEEQESAMQYYVDYFDDAGTDNVQSVIEQLGSPKRIADIIIAEYRGVQSSDSSHKSQENTQSKSTNKALRIIIAILGFPLWAPLLLAGVATIFALFAVEAAVFVVLTAVAVCLVIAGAIMFGAGICSVIVSPIGATLAIGAGLCLVGMGIIGTIFMVWVIAKVVPAAFRLLVKVCRLPFYGKEGR